MDTGLDQDPLPGPSKGSSVSGGSDVVLLYAGHTRVLSVRRVHTSSSLKLRNVHPRGRVLNPGDFSRGKKTYHSSSLESRCIYLLSLGAQDGCELCGGAVTGGRELDSEDIHQPAHNSPESSSGRFTSSNDEYVSRLNEEEYIAYQNQTLMSLSGPRSGSHEPLRAPVRVS
ncbi:hypothetical protein EYF80_059123 [Liparis tanakae]|uniref:Uncharacterized protein n=1 Tax=Liparis tanakae TaxID=230148 RepID=A0A4Z2EQT0_9TELE|nr:hypothetical protein EYF80_059123 [Liparis tanakae]